MLKKFEVENFKGFEDTLTFDLAAREYEFNRHLTVDGIVNKAIVYGKNGIGKSCLGFAIFDIISHLTDKEPMPRRYLANYINLDSGKPYARFKYHFQFGRDEIVYEYRKKDPDYLSTRGSGSTAGCFWTTTTSTKAAERWIASSPAT